MNVLMLLFIVFLTGMLLAGDYLIKYAAETANSLKYLILAALLWTMSIPGWYYAVKGHREAIIGALFAVISIIGTTLIGIYGFNEKLANYEWVGLGLAICAMILLTHKI